MSSSVSSVPPAWVARLKFPTVPLSVETLLLLMGTALILPSVAFIAFLVVRDISREHTLVDARLQQEAGDLARALDRDVDRMLTLLDTLAVSNRLKDRDYAGFHASAVASIQRLTATIIVLDGDGRQVLNTRVAYGTPLPAVADRASFETAKATQKPVVSNLFVGSLSKIWVFNIALPIVQDGAVQHVVYLVLTPGHILSILQEQNLPLGWTTRVTDRNGIVAARLFDHDRFVGQSLPPELRPAAGDAAVIATTSLTGDRVRRSMAVSQRTGWTASVTVSDAIVNGSLRKTQIYVASTAMALLLTLLALARYFSRLLVRPMRELVKLAATISPPVRREPLLSPVREVNEIASVLQAASAELNARMTRLLDSELRLNLAQQTAGIAYTDIDLLTGHATASANFEDQFGFVPPTTTDDLVAEFFERTHDDDRAALKRTYAAACETPGIWDAEYRFVMPGGDLRWIRSQGNTIGDASGRPVRLISTSIDVTRDREQEEHIRFLMHEVVHRSKNMMSVIQSMATQTARSSADVAAFNEKFSQRLQGISRSQDVLVAQDWQSAGLARLVRAQLEPFVAEDVDRLSVNGPDVQLTPQAAQSLGLALHELATNAVKYGAFGAPAGRVAVTWGIEDASGGPRLHLVWKESGGPTVSVPSRKGFGSTVFERMVGQSLSAEVSTSYAPTGVVWTLTAPLSAVSTPA